jgi:hypothetical protein
MLAEPVSHLIEHGRLEARNSRWQMSVDVRNRLDERHGGVGALSDEAVAFFARGHLRPFDHRAEYRRMSSVVRVSRWIQGQEAPIDERGLIVLDGRETHAGTVDQRSDGKENNRMQLTSECQLKTVIVKG